MANYKSVNEIQEAKYLSISLKDDPIILILSNDDYNKTRDRIIDFESIDIRHFHSRFRGMSNIADYTFYINEDLKIKLLKNRGFINLLDNVDLANSCYDYVKNNIAKGNFIGSNIAIYSKILKGFFDIIVESKYGKLEDIDC